MRELVSECELTGRRTLFERNGRPVATLVSYDEYLALRETVEIAPDEGLRAMIESADEDVRRNALLLPEDLGGVILSREDGEESPAGDPSRSAALRMTRGNDRLRIAESVERQWNALADHEKKIARDLLMKIDEDPIVGAPLFEPLRGLWSARAEHLRIVYRILPEARFIVILAIARAAA
ncbi:MAG TPA: type II toxin-antitoxin system RelE/ParE family toxin [Thermoanaerobaculia bacterium]